MSDTDHAATIRRLTSRIMHEFGLLPAAHHDRVVALLLEIDDHADALAAAIGQMPTRQMLKDMILACTEGQEKLRGERDALAADLAAAEARMADARDAARTLRDNPRMSPEYARQYLDIIWRSCGVELTHGDLDAPEATS